MSPGTHAQQVCFVHGVVSASVFESKETKYFSKVNVGTGIKGAF